MHFSAKLLTALVLVGVSAATLADIASGTPGSRATEWTIRDLGSLGGARATYSVASAINDRGQVVGFSDTNLKAERDRNGDRIGHAFLWERGRMHDLGTLGGPSSRATGINNRGQIVGCSSTRFGDTHAFLWQNGRMRDLGAFGGSYSCAASINDLGEIVGSSGSDSGGARHAFLWSRGTMTDLHPFGFGSDAFAINTGGQIVGWRWPREGFAEGIVWDKGRVVTLGGPRTTGAAINARGWVAGSAPAGHDGAPKFDHAFLWRDGGRLDLGTLGGKKSYAQGINDAGLVVGWSERQCSRPRAFVWAAGRMNELVALSPRLDVGAAADVDNRGRIVGYVSTGGGPRCIASPRIPEVHAVLWTRTM